MSTVSWGRRERYKFSSYGVLKRWTPPSIPAICAVTYKTNPQNKSHTVIFFGEYDDLSRQAASIYERVVDAWSEGGGTAEDLFVFIHPMPGSTAQQRAIVRENLVSEYRPHINFV